MRFQIKLVPLQRGLIPEHKWDRGEGVTLPEDELGVPEDPAFINPHTGKEATYEAHSDKKGKHSDL